MYNDRNSVTISQALDLMIRELKLQPKLDEARIQQAWKRLMGEPIARYTKSIYLKNNKLFLKIDSPALKNELFYSRDKIKELLNEELQFDTIHDVIIL